MRVALVGPSPNIEGLGLGDTIDSYDMVVRVNTSYLATQTHPNDYGKRIDAVYFTRDITRCARMRVDLKDSVLQATNTKFINTLISTVRFYDKEGLDVPTTNIFDTTSEKFHEKVGYGQEQNTGTKAALHLLCHYPDITELFIVGYSFHLGKKPYVMGDLKEIYSMARKILYGRHKGQNEITYFCDVIMDDERVNLHQTVKDAINIKSRLNRGGVNLVT